jgi:hypothetical protein
MAVSIADGFLLPSPGMVKSWSNRSSDSCSRDRSLSFSFSDGSTVGGTSTISITRRTLSGGREAMR